MNVGNKLGLDPHRDPQGESGGEKQKAPGDICPVPFLLLGAYTTCAMQLPIVWAASSCFCRVAWVQGRRVKPIEFLPFSQVGGASLPFCLRSSGFSALDISKT